MGKKLFVGFSKISTGEITYTMNFLNSCDKVFSDVLIVNKVHERMLKNYEREFNFHSITDLDFNDFIFELGIIIDKYEDIVFIDLNAFFIEKMVSKPKQDIFFSLLKSKVEKGKRIAALDYLDSFVKQQDEYNLRISRAERELVRKTYKLSLNSKLNWFVSKIIPKHLSEQLLLVPDYISVFAPVPLNNYTQEKICFKNDFGSFDRKRERSDNRKTILFGLSKYFVSIASIELIKILCTNVMRKICEYIPINKIVCIDPIGCIKSEKLNGVEIISKLWIPKDEIFELLPTVLFTGAFVPNSTIGTMSINSGIPFVSFIASESSEKSPSFKKLSENEFPGFNSLGWWEDEVFFTQLTNGNAYFDAVHFADLCHENCFQDLSEKLKIGLLVHKVDRYLAERKRNSELPSFQQAMENWLVGEK